MSLFVSVDEVHGLELAVAIRVFRSVGVTPDCFWPRLVLAGPYRPRACKRSLVVSELDVQGCVCCAPSVILHPYGS